MTKRVKCISPHGGAHHGLDHRGDRIFPLRDGSLPPHDPKTMQLPPNEGGYIDNAGIPGGRAAVGQVYDVADDFAADGFHFEDITDPPPQPKTAPAATEPAEGK